MEPIIVPIVAIASLFVAAPMIVFSFVLRVKRMKHDLEQARIQTEMLHLEIEKKQLELKLLQEENYKYDRLIADQERQRK